MAWNWPHLTPIADQLMPYREDVEVGLLIGTNCTCAIKPDRGDTWKGRRSLCPYVVMSLGGA